MYCSSKPILFLGSFVLFSALCVSSVIASSNCYIRFLAEPAGGLTAEDIIQSYGGRIIHTFPANEFICDMSPRQFDKFVSAENVQGLHRNTIPPGSAPTGPQTIGQKGWLNIIGQLQPAPSPPVVVQSTADFCGTIIDTIPQLDSTKLGTNPMVNISATSRSDIFATNYLVGKVAVCLMVMESNGNAENWTEAQKDIAIAEVIQAYDRLSQEAEFRGVDVTWTYEIHRTVPTSDEPIQTARPFEGGWGWIDHAMAFIGMGKGLDAILANNNRMRQQYMTDWGFTFFSG